MHIPTGWTEATPGGMLTNSDPLVGGIIDNEIVSGRWFVIFNDTRSKVTGLPSREEAVAVMVLLNTAKHRYRTTGAMPAGTPERLAVMAN